MTWVVVVSPLVVYALSVVARGMLGRPPRRFALNVETSLLLAFYVLATAGLGLFWVANQQLPPFDWHYLFGYTTLALVGAHLYFNLPTALRQLRRGGTPEPRGGTGRRGPQAVRWIVAAASLSVSYWLGMRSGTTSLNVPASREAEANSAHMATIREFHAFSSHSRRGVVARAPSVSWGEQVPAHADRSRLPVVELAPPGLDRRASAVVTLADLTNVVWSMAGITERRGGLELRTAASSGALFPTEVYVAAWEVEGLAPGLYAYVPREHLLARVATALLDLEAVGAPEAAATRPPFAIVASSVFRRTGQKYRDRAYRYATADAGHALGNAVAVARSIGLVPRFIARFDDARVATALGLDEREEEVLALLAVHRQGSPPGVAQGLLAPAPLPDARELALGATSLVQRATSLHRVSPTLSTGASTPLPHSPAASLDVLRTLTSRRSRRTFSARPLTLAEVSAVLQGSAREAPLLSRAVHVHLVASRVTGLAPGVYRYEGDRHELRLSRSGALGPEAGSAALDQAVVGDAPAVVVLGLERAAIEREGARAYRYGFIEAGVIGARLYLASAAAGLGGCSVGAFYDDEAARLLAIDPAAEWPAHFFALGAAP